MNIFDIVGPVMVGPSSSHTAGAVKIGYISRKLLGESVKEAKIYLHGSFFATGKGHGTDRALVAGLLGMKPDDTRIPHSFEEAEKQGLSFSFHNIVLKDAHPNSCKLILTGESGKLLTVIASSIGGGRIQINNIDGLGANFSGDSPTLIVHNEDRPGLVTKVSAILSQNHINIATMQIYRDSRGGNAVMIIECDGEVPSQGLQTLKELDGVQNITYLSLLD